MGGWMDPHVEKVFRVLEQALQPDVLPGYRITGGGGDGEDTMTMDVVRWEGGARVQITVTRVKGGGK